MLLTSNFILLLLILSILILLSLLLLFLLLLLLVNKINKLNKLNFSFNGTRPRGYIFFFFMLNSAEHEIFSANKK